MPFGPGGGPGRPSRGPRRYIGVKVPAPLADEVLTKAAESGLSITDYVSGVLAKAHGHPVDSSQQEALPLGA